LTDAQKDAANGHPTGPPRRSDFARKAAEIGRGISATMGKLEKLAQRESNIVVFYDADAQRNA
jgi:syntaxin 5